MSEIGAVIETFNSAKQAEEHRNYLLAARYYRLCALFYENGELPVYMQEVEECGEQAFEQYKKCKSMLSNTVQNMLDLEESKFITKSYFISNWNDFVREEYNRISEEKNRYHQIIINKTPQNV